MTPKQAQLIKEEINRLILELEKFKPQTHQQPLDLVEAYGALVEITREGE